MLQCNITTPGLMAVFIRALCNDLPSSSPRVIAQGYYGRLTDFAADVSNNRVFLMSAADFRPRHSGTLAGRIRGRFGPYLFQNHALDHLRRPSGRDAPSTTFRDK